MIRVEVNHNMLDRLGHETLVGKRICDALKTAGIPVIGVFAMRGIERGSLTYRMENDLGGAAHTIQWSEDELDTESRFHRTHQDLKNGITVFKSGIHMEDDEL